MGRTIAFFLMTGLLGALKGSSQTDSVPYSRDFVFREGIYLAYGDFRSNRPVTPERILSRYEKNSMDFLKKEIQKPEITYLDSAGKEQTVKTKNLWGFCSNNTVYIRYANDFNRLVVIGSICHFTAFTEIYLGGYDHYNDTPATMTTGQELRQLMIDSRTGKVGEFNYVNMEELLKQDPALYTEYKALKKKKKKDLAFVYLRKFNEKHPLLFPG